jgi:hypothetical protein
MSQQTALEWVIQELRLRDLEAKEIKQGYSTLTGILEKGLAMEQEQRHESYHRGLQDCSEVEPSGE